jgi:hypothetical protein
MLQKRALLMLPWVRNSCDNVRGTGQAACKSGKQARFPLPASFVDQPNAVSLRHACTAVCNSVTCKAARTSQRAAATTPCCEKHVLLVQQ